MFNHIRHIATLPSIHPNEDPVRFYISDQINLQRKVMFIDEMGNIHVRSSRSSRYLFSAHMDKQEIPCYEDMGDRIKGKLDDAVGCGILLALSEKYDMNIIFSVGEEMGSQGAQFIVKNGLLPNVDVIIVIDTSPKMKLGGGPVFYKNFAKINPEPDFIQFIKDVASSLDITLQVRPGTINDGRVFIHEIRNTIGLEPYIENYHTSEEISAKSDIIDTYKILEEILKREKAQD